MLAPLVHGSEVREEAGEGGEGPSMEGSVSRLDSTLHLAERTKPLKVLVRRLAGSHVCFREICVFIPVHS